MKFEWEEIWDNGDDETWEHIELTYRAKVHGGWLVRTIIMNNSEDKKIDGWQHISQTQNFVADPSHEWEIDAWKF